MNVSFTATDSHTFIVSPDGTGSHRTINAAVADAPSGATIKIMSGVYEEALILEKPVKLLGDADGLVLIQNPTFTAINVRQAEVILENLAWGIGYEQPFLVADCSKIQMLKCLTGQSADLAQVRTTLAEAITHLRESVSASQISSAAQDDRIDVILKNGSSFSIVDSSLEGTNIAATGSQVEAKSSAFNGSSIRLDEKGILSVLECHFQCGSLDPVLAVSGASTAVICLSTFRGIDSNALRSSSSKVSVEDCEFQGLYAKRYEKAQDIDLPPNSYRMTENVIPRPLEELEQAILNATRKPNEDHKTTMTRFTSAIGLTDYVANGIVRKMLWAYFKKFHTFVYPRDQSNTITKEDVLAPLPQSEKSDFIRFWKDEGDLSEGDSQCGVKCDSDVDLCVTRVKMNHLHHGVSIRGLGRVTIQESSFIDNRTGIDSYQEPGAAASLYIDINHCRFERNAEYGVALNRARQCKLYVTISECEVRKNKTGIMVLGWNAKVRQCLFENNSENILSSSFSLLGCVEDCKGIGESQVFKFAQRLRDSLRF